MLPSDPAAPSDTDKVEVPGGRLHGLASRAQDEIERAVQTTTLLDGVPGRSVTLVGVGLVAAAIALSMLPAFYGVGLGWSIVMLAGAAAVALGETGDARAARLPAWMRHPLFAPAYAALVGLHAFLLLRLDVVPLLWTFAALMLGWDQYRRAARAPDGFVRNFDPRRAWHGYRRNVAAGVGVCLAAMFLTWGRSSGYWTGGYSYNYAYRYNAGAGEYQYDYGYDWSPAQYYWPGWELSGRNQSFAMLAVALLFGLLLWAAYRPADGRSPSPRLAIGAGALLALFWLASPKDGIGSLLFFAGLATLLLGAWRIHRGEEAGRWDLEQLWARTVARRKKG